MGKEALISLIDNVDEQEYDVIYRILLKFVKADNALPDEIEAIKKGEAERAQGEVYTHEDVWD